MDTVLESKLVSIAQERQTKGDPSHDFEHIRRVVGLAQKIARSVNADLDVVLPVALFHDTVVYAKNDPRSQNETEESADVAGAILTQCIDFPQEKIEQVKTCIRQCSLSKGIMPELLEAKVLQDADRLEATGTIAIMRTFTSGGQMNRPLYNATDPFREKTEAETFTASLDLFYKRLLVVEGGMHTEYAKNIAKRRTNFLRQFLSELQQELLESEVLHP